MSTVVLCYNFYQCVALRIMNHDYYGTCLIINHWSLKTHHCWKQKGWKAPSFGIGDPIPSTWIASWIAIIFRHTQVIVILLVLIYRYIIYIIYIDIIYIYISWYIPYYIPIRSDRLRNYHSLAWPSCFWLSHSYNTSGVIKHGLLENHPFIYIDLEIIIQ